MSELPRRSKVIQQIFLSESFKYTCIYFFHFWRRKAVTITHEKYLVIIHLSQKSYECLFVRVAKILKFKIVIAELFLKIYFDTGNSLNNPPTPLVNTWLSFLLISEIGEYCFGEFFVQNSKCLRPTHQENPSPRGNYW